MRAILFLDPVDEDLPRRGLLGCHLGGFDNGGGLGAVLVDNTPTRKESGPNTVLNIIINNNNNILEAPLYAVKNYLIDNNPVR